MKYPNTEKLSKAEADLINDLCPNEKAKFDEWFDELKSRYLHVIGYIDIRYWYDVFMSGVDVSEAATMIQTPCIMKFKDDYLLYFDDIRHFNLTTLELRNSTIESCDSNVTNQYLANTYGEVASPEHAEFIVELGKNAKATISTSWLRGKYFNFYTSSSGELHLDFYDEELANDSNERQITIPLPPKQIQTATPEEEFEMQQIMKNAGDNLVLGCEDSKCDEWPCLGDDAISNDGSKVTVRCIVRDLAWCERAESSMQMITMHICNLRKPKTPEEELRDDITEVVWKANDLWTSTKEAQHVSVQEFVAAKIMDKYNITKKPQ